MKNFKINKKSALGVCLAVLLSASGCGNVKKESTPETAQTKSVVETTQDIEVVTTEATTEAVVTEGLDINNNVSIEKTVEDSYERYNEFYTSHGISKDQLRDVVFVLNDKYTDEDGKLIIDEDRAEEAYSNIKKMLGNTGSSLLQSMDNINTIEYDPVNGKDIDNSWFICEHPSFVPLIDKNIAGGQATIEKISEYEELRDHEIKLMNETNKYDREAINNFVINMEIGDYNTNQDHMDNITKNGQKYLLAAYKYAALDFAAKANINTIYLEGYSGVEENIKINPTNEERFMENDVITMLQEGLIDVDTFDNITTEVITREGLGYTVEEKELLEKYTISGDDLRLLMSYAHYLTTMANHKYQKDMCDEAAETYDDIAIIRNNTSSLNNVRKLVFTA